MSSQNFLSSSSDYGSDIDIDINFDFPALGAVDPESDYGSDIDLADESLLLLLDRSPRLYTPPLAFDDLAEDFTPAAFSPRPVVKPVVKTRTRYARNGTLVVEYDELVRNDPAIATLSDLPVDVLSTVSEAQPEVEPPGAIPPPENTRSLYERFRSQRDQLSVTDLVTGVWCEQKFQYTLERGFKRTTPAMVKGTKLHKVLEEQVHTTVPVEIMTPEDNFGLKLFNICQGLLSLEEQGMTRELDVFGYLGGVFVQGIIDEITYINPDLTLESPQLSPVDTQFDTTPSSSNLSQPRFFLPDPSVTRIAYITDTKTRSSRTIPRGSQLRSTALQLMLYHRLLSLLPTVPFETVLAHRSLDGTIPFSDRFVAQVASMTSAITLDELLENNSLTALWALVLRQLEKSIPVVGDTVGVVYRAQNDGRVMARQAWGVDGEELEKHLKDTLKWWRGERESVGVEVEDAWKCRTCEFEESCTWRLGQLERLAGEAKWRKENGEDAREKTKGKGRKGKRIEASEKGSSAEETSGGEGSEGKSRKGKGKWKGKGKEKAKEETNEKKPRRPKRKATPEADADIEDELELEKIAKTDTTNGISKPRKSEGTAV